MKNFFSLNPAAKERMERFLLEKEHLLPFIFLLLLFLAFSVVKPLPSLALVLVALFLPGYILFRHIMAYSTLSSTFLSIPFSLVATSIMFRIGLLFSQSAQYASLAILAGWALIYCLGHIAKKHEVEKIEFIQVAEEKSKYWIAFLAISVAAVISYSLIAGVPQEDKVFWWSYDANWQIATLTYYDSNPIEAPAYLCGGGHGFDPDSYASMNSLIPIYLIKKLTGLSSSAAQQISLTLFFLLMVQGIFALFSKIFGVNTGILSPILVIFPLSVHPYLGDLYGLWRVSLFNALFPWALLLGLYWLQSIGTLLLRTAFLAFSIAIYPFSSILLLPAYAFGFFRNFTKSAFLTSLPVYLFTILFVYFTFLQITFPVHMEQIESISVSAYNIPKIEKELLEPSLNLSIYNIGWLMGLLFLASSAWLGFICIRNPKNPHSDNLALFVTICLGILLSSGVIYMNDRLARYEMAMRYSIVLVLLLPLSAVFLVSIARSPPYRHPVLILFLLLLAISVANLIEFQSSLSIDGSLNDSRRDIMNWFLKNSQPSDVVMYFDFPPSFAFNSIHHLQVRSFSFPAGASSLRQKETIVSCYRRYGLFDVRNETPVAVEKLPEYIIQRHRLISESIAPSDLVIEPLILQSGYFKIYSNSVFRIYKKGSNSQ